MIRIRADRALRTSLQHHRTMCAEQECHHEAEFMITFPVETIAEDGSYRRFEARLFMCNYCYATWDSAQRAESPNVQVDDHNRKVASGDVPHV